jgi:hypothetical protein
MAEFKFGIWGTSRTGKTTYLAMLYQVFLAHPDWDIYTEDDASRIFIEQVLEQMDGRLFPEATVETHTYQYHLVSRDASKSQQRYTLEFLDAPGELYEDYYTRDLRHSNRRVMQRATEARTTDWIPAHVFEYLTSCQGILVFLDPDRAISIPRQRPYYLLLNQLLEDLREYQRSTNSAAPLVAFCVTKIDGTTDLWNRRADIRHEQCYRQDAAFIEHCRKCPVFEQLDERFMLEWLPGLHPIDRSACFALSSIGRIQPDQPNIGRGSIWQRPDTPPPAQAGQSPQFYDFLDSELQDEPVDNEFMPTSISQPGSIRSYGLIEPLLWMINFTTAT